MIPDELKTKIAARSKPPSLPRYVLKKMTMKIRQAGTADVSTISAVIRKSFRDVALRFGLTLENCPTHPSHCTSQWIHNALDKGIRFFLVEDNSSPRGCVAAEDAGDRIMYLERLAVLPAYRHRGIGRQLAEHVFQVANAGGFRRIEIAIIAGHWELEAWYAQLGFAYLRTATFNHLPFDVTFMARDIDTDQDMG